jgi:hypothetical protein
MLKKRFQTGLLSQRGINNMKIRNFSVLNLAILVLIAPFFVGVASAQALGGNALMMKLSACTSQDLWW